MAARFDPIRALEVLDEHGVRFVVIGGVAAIALGSPTITGGLDICYDRSPDNCDNLAEALVQLNARLRGVEEDIPFLLDGRTIEAGDSFAFDTDAGALDCLGTPSGSGGYETLIANSTSTDLGNVTANVAALEDLIRMKRAAGRPKDRVELEILGALRDEIESAED